MLHITSATNPRRTNSQSPENRVGGPSAVTWKPTGRGNHWLANRLTNSRSRRCHSCTRLAVAMESTGDSGVFASSTCTRMNSARAAASGVPRSSSQSAYTSRTVSSFGAAQIARMKAACSGCWV